MHVGHHVCGFFAFISPCELAAGAFFSPPGQSRSFISRVSTIQYIIFYNSNEGVFFEPLFGLFYSFEGLEGGKKVFSRYDNIQVLLSAASLTFEVCNNHIYLCTCTANLQYFCNISYYIALSTNHFVL